MGTLWLWTTEFNILIQITGSILSIAIIFFFYKKPPFVYDKINLTQTKLHIIRHTGYFFIFSQKTTSQTYTVSKMESFKSTSKLIIQMKNEEKVVINYHEWKIGFKKAKELQAILQQLIEERDAV